MDFALSVLDLAPVGGATDGGAAVRHTVELARRAEALGYARIWFAEHHGMPGVASAATEVLIAAAASATSRIRVGAGGVMLPNHAPLQVVERYRTLEALYPGRIDLGLGRAPGTDPFTSRALRRRPGAEVDEQLRELLAFERGDFEEGHPYAGILATPVDVALPPIWMLGSSTGGAQIAGALGVGYAFAGHFALESAAMACALYRESFRPSPAMPAPAAILAVSAICGETDEHGRELASVVGLSFLRMAQAKVMRVPTIAEALAYPYTEDERAMVDQILRGHVFGSPDTVRDKIERLARRTGAAEVMISTMLAEPDERGRSYERIARACGLGGI